MRYDKFERQLYLLLLLTENTNYTAEDLSKKLKVTRRNLYYYFDFLRNAGFQLIKSGYYYHIDRHSPFFRKLHESIDFTENEAVFLRRLLERTDHNNPIANSIKTKLDRFYDLKIINDANIKKQSAHNVEVLCEAIKIKQVVILKDYSSPHGKTVSDRYVEPFAMLNDNNDVRCYEMSSELNKTFKISRMRDVCIVDAAWGNEDKHKQIFTDIFMFSGEEIHQVTMILGQLSYNLLMEEFPAATDYITMQNSGKWLLRLNVCSFLGIGRFVIGLYEDIQVTGDNEFVSYVNNKVRALYKKSEE